VCDLLGQATQRGVKAIKFTMDQPHERIALQMGDSEGWQEIPGLDGAFWSGLVLYLPRISTIESCQGTITDPRSGEEWRFSFSKPDRHILLSKVPSDTEEPREKR